MTRLLIPLLLVLLSACAAGAAPSPMEPAGDRDAAQSISGLDAHRGLDLSCQRDSDCAVKDIGNCCGRYLACVNVDSPVDLPAVARECADKDLAGICGWPDISACACVAGQCRIAGTGNTRNEEVQ